MGGNPGALYLTQTLVQQLTFNLIYRMLPVMERRPGDPV